MDLEEVTDHSHRKRWKRVLYEKQAFPDDHVDDTFLQSLVTNANARQASYWSQMRRTFGFVERMSLVTLFFALFFCLFTSKLSLSAFIIIDVSFLVFLGGSALAALQVPTESTKGEAAERGILRMMKYVMVFLGVLFALSPVLRTLTFSYSDDTMWGLTVAFAFLHIALHDYVHPPNGPKYAGATALNAAMFAAILLASRLPTSLHVLALVTLAIALFGLWPHALHRIKATSPNGTAVSGCLVTVAAVVALMPLSPLLAGVYGCATLGLASLSPLALALLRPLKHEIAGPWDIATPRIA